MRYLKRLPSVALAVAFALWFLVLRPVALGGPASYEIVSGTSMEPRLHSGDLVIAHTESAYGTGDLVVFRVPADQPGGGSLVVHRIVGGDAAEGFVVKGDNNVAPDPWHPRATDMVGRSWIELQGAGAVILTLRRPAVLAATLGALAAAYLFYAWGSDKPSTPRPRGSRWVISWRRSTHAALPGEVVEQ